MPVDKFGRMSDTKTKDTGVSLTYINNNYIRSDGTTPVSGFIDMNGNTLYNVPDPVNPQDVATKEYTDRRKHIIAVNTYYCGNLYKWEYQFTFGGSACTALELGFLMPQSGHIIKIKSRVICNDKDVIIKNGLGRYLGFVILKVTGEVTILENYECTVSTKPTLEIIPGTCEYRLLKNT